MLAWLLCACVVGINALHWPPLLPALSYPRDGAFASCASFHQSRWSLQQGME